MCKRVRAKKLSSGEEFIRKDGTLSSTKKCKLYIINYVHNAQEEEGMRERDEVKGGEES